MGRSVWVVQLAVTAAATVLAAAACSSSGTAGLTTKLDFTVESAAQLVKDSAAAQIARHGVRIHATSSSKSYHHTMDSVLRTDRAEGDITDIMQPVGSSTSTRTETLLEAPHLYMDYAELSQALGLGKKWIELDLDHLPPENSPDRTLANFSQLGHSFEGTDPTQGVLFALTCPDLHKVGVETRNGKRVVHIAYSVVQQTLPASPPPGSGITQAYLDQRLYRMQISGISKSSADVWIGEDGLPVESKVIDSFAGDKGDSVVDSVYSDWGVSVTVTLPPADQVYVVPAS